MKIGTGIALAGMWLAVGAMAFAIHGWVVLVALFCALTTSDFVPKNESSSNE